MKKETITTSLWDASEYLETDEDIAMYLEAALEENDPKLIQPFLEILQEQKEWHKSPNKSAWEEPVSIKYYPKKEILNLLQF